MENRYEHCKMCGSKNLETWKVNGELVRCLECGLIFASKKYNEIDLLDAYDQLYSKVGLYLPKLKDRERLRRGIPVSMGWNKRVILKHLGDYPQNRVLELGASVGDIAWYFQRRGIDYIGIEFDRKIAQEAASMGLNIIAGDYRSAIELVEPDSLDVIVAFEVLEHIQEIRPCLETLCKLLRPKGILAFSIPNSDVYKNVSPPNLNQTAPPIHLNFWNRDSLERTLNIFGLIPIDIQERRIPIRTGKYWRDIKGTINAVWKRHQGPTLICIAQKG